MPYGTDLANSASRHLEAASLLEQPPPRGRADVAGYLYGIAAECALKEIMRRLGLRPREPRDRREDPFYLHFPELKTALAAARLGRHQRDLLKYAQDSQLMQDWDTNMRYAPSADVLGKPIARWAEQARRLVEEMRAR